MFEFFHFIFIDGQIWLDHQLKDYHHLSYSTKLEKKNTYWEVFQLVVFFKVLHAMTGNELPKKHYSLFSHHNLTNPS